MYKVKITTAKNSNYLLRQTENEAGISRCGKYQFFIDDEVKDPDFFFFLNKYVKTTTTYEIAPQNTILMTSEPRSVVNFPKKYRIQFGLVCSCQEKITGTNVIYTPAALSWFVGLRWKNGQVYYSKTYDDIKHSPLPEKKKLISVITSNKAFTQGHLDRINFVKKLKARYGDQIDVFGRGFNDFEDKWEVLAPYKYHIALENSSSKYYWTEKLSDCYLTGTFPIYFGCQNIQDYFPEQAYQTIDIYNFEKAVEVIDNVLANGTYEKNIDALKKSRELVLEDYNLFNVIARCCDTLNPDLPKQKYSIKPAVTLLDWHNFYLYIFERNYFAIKKFFKKLLRKADSL